MTTIKFENNSGIKVFVKFDSDQIIDIIFEDLFLHYVKDLNCSWGVVGDDGLTYAERVVKKYER